MRRRFNSRRRPGRAVTGPRRPRAGVGRRVNAPRLVFRGVLGLSLYFVVAGGEHSVLDARRAEAELAARRAEIGDVRRRSDALRARIASLREDDEALERFARERYGFIRDGEYLYRISEPEPPAKAGVPGEAAIP